MKFGYTGAGTTKVRENMNLQHLYKKKMTLKQAQDYATYKCQKHERDEFFYPWEPYDGLVKTAMRGLYDSDYRIPKDTKGAIEG